MMVGGKASIQLSSTYLGAHQFLRLVVGLVGFYGVGMVLAGRSFAFGIFDWLTFGPNAKGLSDPKFLNYCVFTFGVLGAVIVGWMAMMWSTIELCVSHQREIREIARRGLMASTATWFVLDTGFSIVVAEYAHAIFNLPFVMLLAVPLVIMSANDNANDGKRS